MRKSRTGGIIARLISRTGLDLVGARMFAPSAELVKRYAETIVTETDARHRATQELIRDYVLKNFTGKVNGQQARVLFLVLRVRMRWKKSIKQSVTLCMSAPAARRFATPSAITSPMNRATSLTLSRGACFVRSKSRSARFETLGGIFRPRRRHSRPGDSFSNGSKNRKDARVN